MGYKDKNKQRTYQRIWRKKRRDLFLDGAECAVCGANDSLEFDHINPADKIHHNIWSWKFKRILEELNKCWVLCSLCHAIKTWTDAQKDTCKKGHIKNGWKSHDNKWYCKICAMYKQRFYRARSLKVKLSAHN